MFLLRLPRSMNRTFLAICFCLVPYLPYAAQTRADYDWVNDRFPSILEEVLPTNQGVGWRLGFRTYRDHYTEVLEYSCAFSEDFQANSIVALVRMPDSVSVYDQVMALHRKNRSQSITAIKRKLRIKEWRLTEKTCPALRTLYDEFYNFTLPMLSAKDRDERAKGVTTITLHPMIFDFEATMSRGSMKLSLDEEDHLFVGWAKRARANLDICIQSNVRTNQR